MARVINFSAGPATLPEPVLQQVQAELLDFRGTGMSVMEMSHRSKAFVRIAEQAEADLRSLLQIPAGYRVLFMQGGAYAQFALLPMNLLAEGGSADYVVTGEWGGKAVREARRYGRVRVAASGEASGYTDIPPRADWQLDPNAAYLHITTNETIHGVEYAETPDSGAVPLVADVSSNFLSRPLDVSRYGLLYGGAQKNIGPAGLTIVIVREDLLGRARSITPSVFDYQAVAAADSMLNTPPCFAWYVAGLVFQWLVAQGGLPAIAERNARKAARLYGYLDSQDFYRNPVAAAARSRMNVPFVLADDSLDSDFLEGAEEAGLSGLKGHRAVGGMRASLYNALPEQGVERLIDYMKEFLRRRG